MSEHKPASNRHSDNSRFRHRPEDVADRRDDHNASRHRVQPAHAPGVRYDFDDDDDTPIPAMFTR